MGQNVGCGSCPDCGTENRVHILAVAFRLMRQILVDYARSHAADKRGADLKVELHAAQLLPQERSADVVALDGCCDPDPLAWTNSRVASSKCAFSEVRRLRSGFPLLSRPH
jgi:hypothetical protein